MRFRVPKLGLCRLFLAAFGLAGGLASQSAAAPEDTSQTAAILSGMQICAEGDFSPVTLPDLLADWEQVPFSDDWKEEWAKARVLADYSEDLDLSYYRAARAANSLIPTPQGVEFRDEIKDTYGGIAEYLVPHWAQSIWAHPSGVRVHVEFFGVSDSPSCLFQIGSPNDETQLWIEATATWSPKGPTTFGTGWDIRFGHSDISGKRLATVLVLDDQKLPGFGDQPLTLWYRGNLAPTGMPTANAPPNGADWDALEVALTACRDRRLRFDGWAGALEGWKQQEDLEASVLHFERVRSMLDAKDRVWRAPEFYAGQTADAILQPLMEDVQSKALEALERGELQAFRHPLGWHLVVEASPDPEDAAGSICLIWADTLPQGIVDWLAQGQLGFTPKPALFGQYSYFDFEHLDPEHYSALEVTAVTNPQTDLFSAAPVYLHVFNYAAEREE